MKSFFKKLFAVLISLTLFLSLFGCESKDTQKEEPPQKEVTLLEKEQVIDALERDIYNRSFPADSKEKEFMGLSDANAVGVDRDRFENEVLYPVPDEEDFVAVYDVREYGIFPENKDNAPALNILLKQIKNVEGLKFLRFPQGVYLFHATVNFADIEDLYVVGEDAEWRMTEWTSAMDIRNCKNFHINGFEFDYHPASTVTGTVISTDEAKRSVTLKLGEEFDMSDSRFNGGKVKYGSYMEYVWDETYGAYIPDKDGMLRYNSTGDRVENLVGGSYDPAAHTLTIAFSADSGYRAPDEGTKVSVSYTMYEYGMFMFQSCEKVYMESNDVYASLGMTFVTYNVKDLYMNRTNLRLREGSERLMTSTADGLHANGCYGDMIVTNSLYEASHDDAMNICSFYNTVSSYAGNTLVCGASSATTNYPIMEGDVIEIYDPQSMELIETYTVVKVTALGLSYDLTVDKRIREDISGCLVGNTTRVPALKVENCIIRNKRNRGILAQVRNSEIVNCAFYNVLHGPIMMNASFDIFAEAIIPRSITVRNCKFFDNNTAHGLSADVSAFRNGGTVLANTVRAIEVENNYFSRSAAGAVYFCGTGDCVAKNNLAYDICRSAVNDAQRAMISLVTDRNAHVCDNFAYLPSAIEGFALLYKSAAEGTEATGNIEYILEGKV